jgi:hypothetical protein
MALAGFLAIITLLALVAGGENATDDDHGEGPV